MHATTARQKILLVLFGILGSLVLLEGGLRLAGHVLTSYQERHNRVTAGSGEFVILCIGESTTALGGDDSYPSQLEEILRRKAPGRKIRVINKGLVSKNSADILKTLPGFLDRYHPQLVIAMIGVNDRHLLPSSNTFPAKLRSLLGDLRIVRFFELLGQHLRHKLAMIRWEHDADHAKKAGGAEKDLWPGKEALPQITKAIVNSIALERRIKELSQSLEGVAGNTRRAAKGRVLLAQLKNKQAWLLAGIGRYYLMRQEYGTAEKFFTTALSHDPRNIGATVELGRSFREQGDCQKAVPYFLKAASIKPGAFIPYLELIRCYEAMGDDQKAYEAYRVLMAQNPNESRMYVEVGEWLRDHEYYRDAERIYLKAIDANPTDYALYRQLAEVYVGEGKEKEAEIYFLKARRQEEKTVDLLPATVENYRHIVDMILGRGVQLICMQYPLRDITPLKKIFPSGYPVIFVANKDNFKEALKGGEYTTYFTDFFGGDFGHCTRAGNRLIATNLAGVILTKVFGNDPSPSGLSQ